MTKVINQAVKALAPYAEDLDGYVRYFHGASREAHEFIQQSGFMGRVEKSDLKYTKGNADCIYVAPFSTIDQCFEYAGQRGVIYIFEYTQVGCDDVYSNRSGSEYFLPVNSKSFCVYGWYDLLSQEFVKA